MYEKDAPEQSSSERDEAERLNQSRKQGGGEEIDQPPVPDKNS
ncbi:MAG TPA: hypothetical protein VGZ02_13450 [Candidatus Baltobacteraceae bacterium]|jgi:hypothetical protein|nr:hypothetical protein [Candidatus Baltobacteraceae bacterium]